GWKDIDEGRYRDLEPAELEAFVHSLGAHSPEDATPDRRGRLGSPTPRSRTSPTFLHTPRRYSDRGQKTSRPTVCRTGVQVPRDTTDVGVEHGPQTGLAGDDGDPLRLIFGHPGAGLVPAAVEPERRLAPEGGR